MEDQRSDLQRVLDAIDDLEPHASIELLRDARRRRCASPNFDVTAVVCDEELIDVEPGRHDRPAVRDRVRPRHDDGRRDAARSRHRTARRGALDAQPPAALRRRRDHADLGDDDGRRARSGRCATAPTRRWPQLTARGAAPRATSIRAEVYEITVCGNVTMMQLALGIDPEPLSMAPFIVVDPHASRRHARATSASSVHPRAPAFVFPSLGAYVGGDIVAGMLATGLTRDRRRAPVHRRRHEQRDRARLGRARAGHRGAGRTGVRGGADPLRDARRRRRDRGRAGSTATSWRSR